MGDKSKKDMEKGKKRKINKQSQKEKKSVYRQSKNAINA